MLRRLAPGSLVVPALVAAMAAAVLGSSSVPALADGAKPWRWAALGLLLAVAGWAAVAGRHGLRLMSAPAAAGAALVALALCSALWSVEPRLTVERTASVALLLAACWAVGRCCAGDRRLLHAAVVAIGGAAVVLSVAGLVVAAAAPETGFFLATSPTRFRGLGENPNTVPLVQAVALPLLAWAALAEGGGRRRRLAAGAGLVLIAAVLLLSESRGSLVAAVAGLALVAGLVPRRTLHRAAVVAAVVAVAAGGWFAAGPVVAAWAPPPAAATASGGAPARAAGVGSVVPRSGSLADGSGRTLAWEAALDLGDRRPVGGHGFGTEAAAFGPIAATLAPAFESTLVESSYLGAYVQLGALGLAALAALIVAIGVAALRAIRGAARGAEAALAVALSAAVLAGLVQGAFQSYLWSAGNIAAVPLWACAALLVGLRR